MASLLKRQTVLKRTRDYDSHTAAAFETHNEETLEIFESLWIPFETLEAMGNPDQLTITIEPGDTLQL